MSDLQIRCDDFDIRLIYHHPRVVVRIYPDDEPGETYSGRFDLSDCLKLATFLKQCVGRMFTADEIAIIKEACTDD